METIERYGVYYTERAGGKLMALIEASQNGKAVKVLENNKVVLFLYQLF